MANHFDLEEQEQLDQLKHFWKQYGNAISWVLIAVFGAFAAWNGYQWWTKRQAEQASAMYEEVDRVISAGDIVSAEKAFDDMKQRFPATVYTQQAGLTLAKVAYLSGKPELAQKALNLVADGGPDEGLAALARIRQASVQLELKKFDDSEKLLNAAFPAEFAGLVADKKADLSLARGKREEAIGLYKEALQSVPERDQYRRLIEVKLASLGASESP